MSPKLNAAWTAHALRLISLTSGLFVLTPPAQVDKGAKLTADSAISGKLEALLPCKILMTSRRLLPLGVFAVWLGLLFCNDSIAAPNLDVVVSPVIPKDEEDPGTGNPIKFFDNYSWRLFVALNWPAMPDQRGEADGSKSLGDLSATSNGMEMPIPRVWETWKSVEEVFSPDGKAPSDWNTFDTIHECQNVDSAHDATAKVLTEFTKLDNVLGDLNQVNDIGFPVGPLIARNRTYVRYEIRMNQAEFEFIRSKKLYRRENLPKPEDEKELPFASGSIGVKAAWREFKLPVERGLLSRYYHRDAWAFNPATKQCEKKTFGLVGFHVTQKTPHRPQWTWSTFEHVDNLSVGPDAPTGTESTFDSSGPATGNISPPAPITSTNGPLPDPQPVKIARQHFNTQDFSSIPPPETKDANSTWHADPKIKATVWENYDLIMTQWPVPADSTDADFTPFPANNVANISMETYVQRNSCLTCHQPTTNHTDFVWFVSIRAFPPLGTAPPQSALRTFFFGKPKIQDAPAGLRQSARQAQEAAKRDAVKEPEKK
jgi:hypothetical protein